MNWCQPIVSADGSTWTCAVCRFGPWPVRPGALHRPCGNANDPHGPGTHLKSLLSRLRIIATKDCKCERRAKLMNLRGADWCAANTEKIVGWLREEHAGRRAVLNQQAADHAAGTRKAPPDPMPLFLRLAFSETAARLLVNRAIARAQKSAAASAARPSASHAPAPATPTAG